MSSSLLVRAAEADDIVAIAAIYRHAVVHGTASYETDPPDEAEMMRRWREIATAGFPYLVAEREGRLLGYAYAGLYRTRRAYRYSVEDSVYVDPSAQGMGVGRTLLAEIVRICEASGFRQMIAVIGDGTANPASVGLHQSLGFRHIGIIDASGFKHGRWLDTVLMQRQLGPGRTTPPDDV